MTPSSGLPKMSDESTSTMPGTVRSFVMRASEIFASWFRSGPLMTYMISAFFWPLEKAFT